MLDGVVEWIVEKSPSTLLINSLYDSKKIEGKNPNDVYALVNLAEKRLDAILAKYKED